MPEQRAGRGAGDPVSRTRFRPWATNSPHSFTKTAPIPSDPAGSGKPSPAPHRFRLLLDQGFPKPPGFGVEEVDRSIEVVHFGDSYRDGAGGSTIRSKSGANCSPTFPR